MQANPTKCLIKLNISLKGPLPKGEGVYITGNLPILGNWAPDGKRLEATENGKYSAEIPCLENDIIEFKITRGSWQTQAIYDDSSIPPENTVIKAQKSTEININIINWLDTRSLKNDPVIGSLAESPQFECKGLKYPRRAQIWLPKSYDKNKTQPYAAIYMHDAQNLFEPAKAFAGVDWRVDETISELIEKNEIKHCVVIAVPNSPKRMSELNLSLKEGKAYASFIINEVMPWAENNFNISKRREDRVIMGSSMGGLMSFQMIHEHNNLFAGAGCLSCAFSFDKEIFEKIKKSTKLPRPTKIYLDSGEYEKPVLEAYKKMMSILKQKGYRENIDFMGFFDPKATHCETRWASRLHIPLKFLLKR